MFLKRLGFPAEQKSRPIESLTCGPPKMPTEERSIFLGSRVRALLATRQYSDEQPHSPSLSSLSNGAQERPENISKSANSLVIETEHCCVRSKLFADVPEAQRSGSIARPNVLPRLATWCLESISLTAGILDFGVGKTEAYPKLLPGDTEMRG
jgi:hypothetical protein